MTIPVPGKDRLGPLSDGWLYRVALETILGFRVEGSRLLVHPYIRSLELDGAAQAGCEIVLADDGQRHEVRVVLGLRERAREES